MEPIRQLLEDSRIVLMSPDGDLNLVPFGVFVDKNDDYLIEHTSFTYLTSGRDLLAFRIDREGKGPSTIVANPDFDAQIPIEAQSDSRRSADFLSKQYPPLPATADEANALVRILPGPVLLLTGKHASETALKEVSGPWILHVAAHGFFLPDQKPVLEEEPPLNLIGPGQPHFRHPLIENPLLRSGLILAGANREQSGPNDGVLTALELSGLDLWGTELVVLSACDTGLGDVRNHEGVYGLRRALVIAGSESQVLSLWKVADEATRDLMIAFYRNLISGMGRSEALRQAQLRMLESHERSHPFFWASFVLSGEWTNLDGRPSSQASRDKN